MVLGIQLAGMMFGIFMMYYTFIKYKRKELAVKEYLFWGAIWVVFVVVSLFPNWLDPITKSLSIARTFDFLVTVGFLFIIGIMFFVYTIVMDTRRDVENIVRELAMRKKK